MIKMTDDEVCEGKGGAIEKKINDKLTQSGRGVSPGRGDGWDERGRKNAVNCG